MNELGRHKIDKVNLHDCFCDAQKRVNLTMDKRAKMPTIVDKGNTFENIDCADITRLSVFSSFEGTVPELSIFPNLRTIHITPVVKADYIKRQDFSNIEEARFTIEKFDETISIASDKLKSLSIYIFDNEDKQLSIFDISPGTIDISQCCNLEELTLRHFSGYRLVGFENSKATSISLVDCNNSLPWDEIFNKKSVRNLMACECNLDSIDFIEPGRRYDTLNISYNNIQNIDVLEKIGVADYLNVRRNPISDFSVLSKMNTNTVIMNDRDSEMGWFLSDLMRNEFFAMQKVASMRRLRERQANKPWRKKIDNKTKDTEESIKIKQIHDEIFAKYRRKHKSYTDEELFKIYLTKNIRDSIDRSTERIQFKHLTNEDLEQIIKQRYDFEIEL